MPTDAAIAAVETVATPEAGRVRARLTGVVGGLTVANMLNAAGGFVTGPLTARALGASGRGDLAAILAPLGLVPGVVGFGITGFPYRALPRGRRVEEVVGSLGLPLLVIGVATAAGAIPIADALAGGRETVRTFLIVGLLTTPLVLVAGLLLSSLAALERWGGVVATNAIPFVVPFVAIVALYALGRLTVAAVAAATIAGSVLALVPGLLLLPGARRPVFDLSLARRGVNFGLRSWVGGLALLANSRLDQILMISVVAPRVLGLYVVATTIAGVSGIATAALSRPLMTRVAGGELHLLPQAVRIVVAATAALNLVLALVTPTALSVLFGPSFRGAATMARVLLAANVSSAGASVLSSALQADGAPLIPSVGEGLALVITVVGLAVLLRPLEGVGAAIVSFGAYSTSFLFQLAMAQRRVRLPLSDFLVPSRADVRWARGLITGVMLRVSRRR